MSFKFLEHMKEEDASLFLQQLFRSIVDSLDDGSPEKLEDALINGQVQGYSKQKNFEYETGPFTPVVKPVKEMKLTLITSSGHFVKGHDPQPFGIKDMTQAEAERRIMESIKEEPVLS